MTKRIPFLFTFTFVLSFLFTANALFAQILITSSDLLSLMGKKITMKTEEEGSFTFNSGSPGANQVWDLRSLNFISPQVFEQLFSSPSVPHTQRFFQMRIWCTKWLHQTPSMQHSLVIII